MASTNENVKENVRVKFVKRPGPNNFPTDDCFSYEKCDQPPSIKTKTGEEKGDAGKGNDVIIRTLYLSMDPALRCRMNEQTGAEYLTPWQIGETVTGLGGVGVIEESVVSEFKKGDIVAASMCWPWMLYFSFPQDQLTKIELIPPGHGPSVILSCFGLTGLTALLGLQEKGHIAPGGGQTLVVSGAAGATGSLAVQIGRLLGASRVVGICGSEAKCAYLKDDLKADAVVNYKETEWVGALKDECPKGVDVYFDNVGGIVSEAIIKLMNKNSHVVLCGQISQYNQDVPYPPPIPAEISAVIAEKNITRERFLVLNYQEKFEEGLAQLAKWLSAGELKVRENVVQGLENAGKAFVGMMKGDNIGKQIVKV